MTAPISKYVTTLLRDKYFAAAPDIELGGKLWSRYEQLQGRLHPMGDLWESAYSHYYGDDSFAGRTWSMSRRGEQGELAAIRINRARRNSKARQALILAGIIKPKARASNNDAEAAYATMLAELLAEYDFKKGGLDALWAEWVEQSEVFSAAYTYTRWVPWAGETVGEDDGRLVREGDVVTHLLPPWLVEFDESYPTADESPWHFVRTYESKVELLLNYTRLLDGRDGDQVADAIWGSHGDERLQRISRVSRAEHDTACVVNFVHYPSTALPLGLFVRMLDPDTVLERRALIGDGGDYDETGPRAVQRLAADNMADSPQAWCTFFNVLAAQEMGDSLLTTHATLLSTYTDPIYAVSNGNGNDPEKLASGPGRKWLMGVGDEMPKLIERPEVSESAMKFDEMIASEMERDMSLNDAVMGRQGTGPKNAQADALQASQAVQQVGPASRAARAALGKLQELRVKTLRKNAKGERLLRIVGSSKQHLLLNAKTYTSQQLKPFDGFDYEESNPMEATPQGRWAVVELYQKLNLLRSVEDVDSAIATGRLEPVVDPVRDENLLIMAENDAIRRGENPPVFVTQNGILHLRRHMCTTMTPQALQDEKLLAAWQAHTDVHYVNEFGLPPQTADIDPATGQPAVDPMTGQPKMRPTRAVDDPLYQQRWKAIMGLGPMPPEMGPPQPGAPGAPGAPPGGPPAPGGDVGPPPAMPPNGPDAVKKPTNPLDGQTFSNTQPPATGAPPS